MEQITDTFLMVRPAHFGYNEDTATSNVFQTLDLSLTREQVEERARQEFDTFVHTLRDAGVRVIIEEDTGEPLKPDAVFPNNWISFHEEGTIITYPMFAPQRRMEVRNDIVQRFQDQFPFNKLIELDKWTAKEQFLEGTGSMVFDRLHRIVYACRSNRTHQEILQTFAKEMEYQVHLFTAQDMNGQDIYHTNVLMAVGETFVVICLDAIRDKDERGSLEAVFRETGKEIISISLEQMMAFAGNMLQVRNQAGDTMLVMSEQAYRSLRPAQMKTIEQHTGVLFSPLITIETFGGGSARCMMAEVFYPGMTKRNE